MKSLIRLFIILTVVGYQNIYAQNKAAVTDSGCYNEYLTMFMSQKLHSVKDGQHRVVIALFNSNSSNCYEGKVKIIQNEIVAPEIIKHISGNNGNTDFKIHQKGNVGSSYIGDLGMIKNGMLCNLVANDSDEVCIFFIECLTGEKKTEKNDVKKTTSVSALAVSTPPSDSLVLKLVADSLQFDSASAVLSEEAFIYLDNLIGLLKAKQNYLLIVNGYADQPGNTSANKKLSESRSKAVRAYLIEKGLLPDKVVAYGRGGAKPISVKPGTGKKIKSKPISFELKNVM